MPIFIMLKQDLSLMNVEGLILDIDGVISRGRKPIERAIEGYRMIKELGIKIVFVSNNSTRSRRIMLERFKQFGLEVKEGELIIATHATAVYIAKESGKTRIFTTGENGLKEELLNLGHELVDYRDAEYLVVGSNRGINFEIFTKALRLALDNEIRYVAVNPDRVFPAEDGPIPGTGLIIGALYWMTGKQPDVVVGKPSRIIIDQAIERLGVDKEKVAIVGDQIDVDIVAGKNAGIKSILVMSGVTNQENYAEKVRETGATPDFIFDDLYDLSIALRSGK